MAGIYLHIPFCKQACYYCDFHFSTLMEGKTELVQAICSELELQQKYLEAEPIETIYFGGGTPSLLSEEELHQILSTLHRFYPVASHPEVTLEANPDDLTQKKVKMLAKAGINRLSIGIQSFDDTILKTLHRAHSGIEAERCVRIAREGGITNISIDLIYAIPMQNKVTLRRNLEKALLLEPDHISCYSLTIEDKTVFGKWQKAGKFKGVSEETSAGQFEQVMSTLIASGFDHYEISNFAKPGYYSRHNTSYWQQKKYLGIGPSAHSYNGFSRQFNIANNALYSKSIAGGKIPCETEILTRENLINEYIFTTLRTKWGCRTDYLNHNFQFDLLQERAQLIEKLSGQNLIAVQDGVVLLTARGKLLADQIAVDFFV